MIQKDHSNITCSNHGVIVILWKSFHQFYIHRLFSFHITFEFSELSSVTDNQKIHIVPIILAF